MFRRLASILSIGVLAAALAVFGQLGTAKTAHACGVFSTNWILTSHTATLVDHDTLGNVGTVTVYLEEDTDGCGNVQFDSYFVPLTSGSGRCASAFHSNPGGGTATAYVDERYYVNNVYTGAWFYSGNLWTATTVVSRTYAATSGVYLDNAYGTNGFQIWNTFCSFNVDGNVYADHWDYYSSPPPGTHGTFISFTGHS